MKALIDNSFRIEDNYLEIYCIPNVLEASTCNALIECIDKYCVPSTVTSGSKMIRMEARKSSTCKLEEWPEYKIHVKTLQDVILKNTQLDQRHSEPLQGQRYLIGEYYQRHTDFFTPKTPTYDTFTERGGQRIWTAMIYLNDVVEGGDTFFPTISTSVIPTRGTMLVWNNLNHLNKENFYSMHEARPPISNSKYVVTQWFRQNFYR
jgi:prolyl 4-hydroxylase